MRCRPSSLPVDPCGMASSHSAPGPSMTTAADRQIVISSAQLGSTGFEPRPFGRWWLHAGPEARVDLSDRSCVLGLGVELESGRRLDASAVDDALEAGGTPAVAALCDRSVGRFAVVFTEPEGGLLVAPDGWASLQLFWQEVDRTTVLTTSPGILQALGADNAESAFADLERARSHEYRALGFRCPVSGGHRLRANHLLRLPGGRREPLPMIANPLDWSSLTALLGRAMSGLHAAHGGELRLPITSGVDSRWLAVAASKAALEPSLFTFVPTGATTLDAEIGGEVARRLGFRHDVVELPATVSDAVRCDVAQVRGFWRDLDKMVEIEWYAANGARPLVFNGNGGEVLRGSAYGLGPRLPGRRFLRALCVGSGATDDELAGYDEWYRSRAPMARSSSLSLYELFYWEQRMPNWGSDFYAEKENVVDELSPFSCRHLLLAGPAVRGRRHKIPAERSLAIEPSVAGIPFNPGEHRNRARRSSIVRQLAATTRDSRARLRWPLTPRGGDW